MQCLLPLPSPDVRLGLFYFWSYSMASYKTHMTTPLAQPAGPYTLCGQVPGYELLTDSTPSRVTCKKCIAIIKHVSRRVDSDMGWGDNKDSTPDVPAGATHYRNSVWGRVYYRFSGRSLCTYRSSLKSWSTGYAGKDIPADLILLHTSIPKGATHKYKGVFYRWDAYWTLWEYYSSEAGWRDSVNSNEWCSINLLPINPPTTIAVEVLYDLELRSLNKELTKLRKKHKKVKTKLAHCEAMLVHEKMFNPSH